MTSPADPLLVLVTRIEGKVDTLAERVSAQGKQHTMSDAQLQRAMDALRESIREAREEARRETTGATARLEAQLEAAAGDLHTHVHAKNPHPEQEEWLRVNLRVVADQVGEVRTELDTAKGAGRVVSALLGSAAGVVAGVATALISQQVGG